VRLCTLAIEFCSVMVGYDRETGIVISSLICECLPDTGALRVPGALGEAPKTLGKGRQTTLGEQSNGKR